MKCNTINMKRQDWFTSLKITAQLTSCRKQLASFLNFHWTSIFSLLKMAMNCCFSRRLGEWKVIGCPHVAGKSWHGSRSMQQCLYVYLLRQLLPWSWRQNRLNVMQCSLASSTYPDLLKVSVRLTWVLALACSRPIILAWKPYIY